MLQCLKANNPPPPPPKRITLWDCASSELLVVYHLPKKSGNFGWNVNGKPILVFPKENFLDKTGFLER